MYCIIEDKIIVLDNLSFIAGSDTGHYQEFLDYVIENGTNDIDGGEEVTQEDYTVLRQQEYPSMAEQLDMQYWDNVNGTTVWQDTIDAIKAKYPKTMVRQTVPKPVPAWVQEEADKKRQLQEV